MNTRLALGLAAVAATALASAARPAAVAAAADAPPAAAAPAPAPKGSPLLTLAGTDSGVTRPLFARVESDARWREVWAEHRPGERGGGSRPRVDFGRCVVVALFEGQTANTEPLEVESVTETADAVVVRFDFAGYATAANVEPRAVTPYGFVVLPRTDKPIVLERNAGHSKEPGGVPRPKWAEAARLPAGR
ncbi:MAG TPA: hypothetical protein VF796_12990 [Humisphaera sp.]